MTTKRIEDSEYTEKISNYQDAIHNCAEVKGTLSYYTQNGDNDPEDRYWSSIFHKTMPDPTLDKETRLGYGFGGALYSVVFVYDHLLKKTLCVRLNYDLADENHYCNRAKYAQFFEKNHTLVVQYQGAFILYKVSPKTMKVVKTIDSRNTADAYDRHSSMHYDRIIFESTGLNYLASITHEGDPTLIKFSWKTGKMAFDGLPGYMTRFGGMHCLFVKELPNHPIVVLGMRGKQECDPDMGYALFVQNGESEREMNLYNFKNEFFQQWTPRHFTFSRVNKQGYITIGVYTWNKSLLTKTTVPINMNYVKVPSNTITISDLAK